MPTRVWGVGPGHRPEELLIDRVSQLMLTTLTARDEAPTGGRTGGQMVFGALVDRRGGV